MNKSQSSVFKKGWLRFQIICTRSLISKFEILTLIFAFLPVPGPLNSPSKPSYIPTGSLSVDFRRIASTDARASFLKELRLFYHQWLGLLAIFTLALLSESWVPHHSSIYHNTEEEIWKYSYPLKLKQHVSPYAVPFIAILSPAITSLLFALFGRISMTELHHTLLVGTSCVAFTGLVTNTIKVNVGRPRPNFIARCFGDHGERRFDAQGVPLCNDDAIDPDEGFKSFPSGHTSWATSGLGYMSFWIMGKLPTGVPHPLQTAGSMLPLLTSALIGASRLQDNWHHPEDVIAGYMLGLVMAWVFYRGLYSSGGNGSGAVGREGSFGGLDSVASKDDVGLNV